VKVIVIGGTNFIPATSTLASFGASWATPRRSVRGTLSNVREDRGFASVRKGKKMNCCSLTIPACFSARIQTPYPIHAGKWSASTPRNLRRPIVRKPDTTRICCIVTVGSVFRATRSSKLAPK
jgi:hypothetical protein